MKILVLNCGSATLKFQLIEVGESRRLLKGMVEGIGGEASISVRGAGAEPSQWSYPLSNIHEAVRYLLSWLGSEPAGPGIKDLAAVGHRVVHGGDRFTRSVLITEDVLAQIEACRDLAPLHNPDNLEGIRAARAILGSVIPQVAVFDTAFHQTMPEKAYLYAIPYRLYTDHRVRRYGFHGTSHRYVAERYAQIRGISPAEANLIVLHLGNGCSAAAVKGGRSIDTSMGMTPLEGLVMGTRSGDIDPSIYKYLAPRTGMGIEEIEWMLNHESGLRGISGLANDMRELLEAAFGHGHDRARLAIEIFCYRLRKYIGAYLAAMGGAEALVFTGGIGENAPRIREMACEGLDWMGVRLDRELNSRVVGQEARISEESSRLAVYVIPTDEELLIARDTASIVAGRP